MGFNETIIFYLLIGASVATAVFLTKEGGKPSEQLFRVATSVLFWPLYLPILLSKTGEEKRHKDNPPTEPRDPMAGAIAQVEAELDAALSRLDGWAEDVLARETDRIAELRAAWNSQATRIREMDQLLAEPGFADAVHPVSPHSTSSSGSGEGGATEPTSLAGGPAAQESNDRCRQSLQARQQNIERLRAVRHRAYEELMGTLAWVRELVSMIHLAKFTGAPPSRAEELVAQIAAAVEGISQVTWQDDADSERGDSRGPAEGSCPAQAQGVPPHRERPTRTAPLR